MQDEPVYYRPVWQESTAIGRFISGQMSLVLRERDMSRIAVAAVASRARGGDRAADQAINRDT